MRQQSFFEIPFLCVLLLKFAHGFLLTNRCVYPFRDFGSLFPLKSFHDDGFRNLFKRKDIVLLYERKPSFSGDINTGNKTAESILFRGAEIFGALFSEKKSVGGLLKTPYPRSRNFNSISIKIKQEYENIFWATGNMDVSLWAPNCTFADPFNSFGGSGSRDRFKSNADNLGKLVDMAVLKVTKFEANERDRIVTVGWTFSGRLKLPWRPVLAAAGETSHVIDADTGLIVKYEERWKSDPWEVVKRLFVPGK